MADETTNTVKKVSDGVVTINVERYHELVAKAAETAPTIYTQIIKTPAMRAADNKMWGIVFFVGGMTIAAVGAYLRAAGMAEQKKLEQDGDA